MRTRVATWLVLLMAALFIYGVSHMVTSSKNKTPIYISAPHDMESSFIDVLKRTGLKKGYEIMLTDSDSAKITIIKGGSNEEGYQRILFSPFICAMGHSVDQRQLESAGVLVQNKFDSNLDDFDVAKIITAVINENSWEDLGVKGGRDLIVYYPDETTSYWYDFYNFMLVNVNDGKYPRNASEMRKAQETIQNFVDSKNTEAIVNFSEKIERNGGFTENAVYLIPEKLAIVLSNNYSMRSDIKTQVQLMYPRYTVNYNYYIGYAEDDEAAKAIVDGLAESYFYIWLSHAAYRSDLYQSVEASNYNYFGYSYGHRNVYTVINIENSSGKTVVYEETVTETE